MLNSIDFEDAIIGATPMMLAKIAQRMTEASASVRTKRDLKTLAYGFRRLGGRLRIIARENVDVASKAGLLPSRYLGFDSEREFPGGIAGGGRQTVNVTPAVGVKIIGFRTDDSNAPDFNIFAIEVATVNLILGQDACPATMFTTGIALPPTSAPQLPGGSAASIGFANIVAVPRRGRGGFPVIKTDNPQC